MELGAYYLGNYANIYEYNGFAWSGNDRSLFGNINLPEDFELIYRKSDGRFIPNFFGDKWEKVRVIRDVDKVHAWNDYPMVSQSPAFSKRAIDCLHDLLEPHGEILPVSSEDGDYFVYNCTTQVDILDFDKSVFFHKYKDDQMMGIRGVTKYEFNLSREELDNLPFFRINRFDLEYFVNHRFVDRIREHSLNGFMPIKVWPFPKDTSWKDCYREAMKLSQSAAAKRRNARKNRREVIPPLQPLEFLTL
ncbi:MAG: hypothetical protein AAGB26_04520 [Planctomycetota bacterium]